MIKLKADATILRISSAMLAATLGLLATSEAQMMMLPGQFDVSPSGSALYTVPIEAAPGTAGMSPAVTLDYNSAGGNGLLGVGWSLGGLPSIGRCPQTKAQDNGIDGVSFDNNDRYCIDGQRLIVISGTYGAANSEYRTEIEGFTKVVAYGAAGNGPSYFKAWTKSGQVMEFGNTTDSRILAEGTSTARSWGVNEISDTVGNYLTVTYNNDIATSQAYPTRIDYTGNAGESLSPYNSMRFEYEARPDVIEKYAAGSIIKTTVRLKKVKTYEGANVVKSYELTYGVGSSTNRSRVTEIKLCDGAGVCLPATAFSLTDATLGFPNQSTNPIPKADLDNIALYTADWNGDGVTDIMAWDPATGDNTWFINNGALGFTKMTSMIPPADIKTPITSTAGSAIYLGDWNGDGLIDLMWADQSTFDNRWFVNSSGLNFTKHVNKIDPLLVHSWTEFEGFKLADWNGDGVTDVMTLQGNTGSNRWFINDGNLSFSHIDDPIPPNQIPPQLYFPGNPVSVFFSRLYFGDWNGDGIVDAMWRNPLFGGDNRWFINDGNLNFTQVNSALPSVPPRGSIYVGDWNADGVSDVLRFNTADGTNIWFINDGAMNFSEIANPIAKSTVSGAVIDLGDWNADGIADVMFHDASTGTNRWFVNDGNLSFDYYSNPITPSSIDGTGGLAFGDWNGDGFTEPMWHDPGDGANLWFYDTDDAPDMLSSVTTGLGSTTSITYKPLTDASVYTKGSGAVFPVIDFEAPLNVVSRVDAADGIGGHYSSEYAYTGAKINLEGRGFLGFREQTITDLQTNVVQKIAFLQDYPFIGFVEKDEKSHLSQLLNRRTNTYAASNLGGTRRFPYLDQFVEESNDLNGVAFPSVTTTYAYDTYGNPTQIVVTNSVDSAVQTTTNIYTNDAVNWLLGRLTNATVASMVPDVTPTPTGNTSQDGSGGDQRIVIVVPLNGFTVIPIQ